MQLSPGEMRWFLHKLMLVSFIAFSFVAWSALMVPAISSLIIMCTGGKLKLWDFNKDKA